MAKISNPKSYDPYIGDEFWTHMLFNSFWVGRQNDVGEAQRMILPRYMESCHQITWTEFSQLMKLKAKAQAMLEERIESKAEAQRQYWLSKGHAVVA
jgi:hypothetical protein